MIYKAQCKAHKYWEEVALVLLHKTDYFALVLLQIIIFVIEIQSFISYVL